MANNPGMWRTKGWNRLEATWHAVLVGMDNVKKWRTSVTLSNKKAGRNTRNQIYNVSAVGLDCLSPMQDYDGGYQEKKIAKIKQGC